MCPIEMYGPAAPLEGGELALYVLQSHQMDWVVFLLIRKEIISQ